MGPFGWEWTQYLKIWSGYHSTIFELVAWNQAGLDISSGYSATGRLRLVAIWYYPTYWTRQSISGLPGTTDRGVVPLSRSANTGIFAICKMSNLHSAYYFNALCNLVTYFQRQKRLLNWCCHSVTHGFENWLILSNVNTYWINHCGTVQKSFKSVKS